MAKNGFPEYRDTQSTFIVTPERAGAVGNGIPDDREALVSWAAEGGFGKVLHLKPKAVYRMASRGPIVFGAGSIVNGNGATILLDYSDTSNNYQIETGIGTKVTNLNVKWSGANYAERGVGVGEGAIWSGGTVSAVEEQPKLAEDESQDATMVIIGANARVDGVTFRNIWNAARVNAADSAFVNCDFYTYGKGVKIEDAAAKLLVEGNRFHSASTYATQAPGEGGVSGIASNATVRGNTVYFASEHGFYLAAATAATGVIVEGNSVIACGQSGYKIRNCDVRFIGNTAQDAAYGSSTGTTEDAASFEGCSRVVVNGFAASGLLKSNAGNYGLRFDSCAEIMVDGLATDRVKEAIILITDARIRAGKGGYEHVRTNINGVTVQDPGGKRFMDIVFTDSCGPITVTGIDYAGGSGTVLTTNIAGTAGAILLEGNISTTGTLHNNIAGGASARFVLTDKLEAAAGSQGAPSITFGADTDTGIYSPGANQLGLTTGGSRQVLLSSAAMQVDVPVTGTAITQSATDTTTGRLLKVGDFGLGGNAPALPGDDANGSFSSGTYSISTTTLNTPSTAAGVMQVLTRSTSISAVPSQFHVLVKNRSGGGVSMFLRSVSGSAYGAWAEVWDTHNLKVTTSATDSTAGRITKVGDFGLGGTATSTGLGENWGDITESRVIACASVGSAPTDKPAAANNNPFVGWHLMSGATRWAELVQETSGSYPWRIWARTSNGGVTQDWDLLFTRKSLLGTVSQTSGVPTGAAIERGTNANGEYTKFADGTMICRVRKAGAATTTAIGALFRSDDITWTYPVAFAAEPQVTASCAGAVNLWANARPASSGNMVSAVARLFNYQTDATAYDVAFVAVGRWF